MPTEGNTRGVVAADKAPSFWQRNGKIIKSLFVFGLWFACLVLIGVIGEGWTFVTSLYVGTQIVTTVGYGDISISPQFRLCVCIFAFGGIALVANILNDLCNAFLDSQMESVRAKLRKVEALASNSIKDEKEAAENLGAMNGLVSAFVIFTIFVLGGAAFFVFFEPCSCSYGVTAIDGCVAGAQCASTGGMTHGWKSSIYMAVITLTTIGFGDVTPVSESGRVFSCVWMLLGVIAAGNFVTAIGAFIEEKKKESTVTEAVDRQTFDRLDKDKSGALSRSEFRSWVLIKEGLVAPEDLERLDNLFDTIDSNKNQRLSYDELQAYFRPKKTTNGRGAAAREVSGESSLVQPLNA